jgi:hypothetical protein
MHSLSPLVQQNVLCSSHSSHRSRRGLCTSPSGNENLIWPPHLNECEGLGNGYGDGRRWRIVVVPRTGLAPLGIIEALPGTAFSKSPFDNLLGGDNAKEVSARIRRILGGLRC